MTRSAGRMVPVVLALVAAASGALSLGKLTFAEAPAKVAEAPALVVAEAPAKEESAVQKAASAFVHAVRNILKLEEPAKEAEWPVTGEPALAEASAAKKAASALVPAVRKILKDTRFRGTLDAAGGWAGSATYSFPRDGYALTVGGKGKEDKVQGLDAALSYKSKGRLPHMELLLAAAPGSNADLFAPEVKHNLKYAAMVSKDLSFYGNPEIHAALTNSGAVIGASVRKPLMEGMDVSMKVDLPYSYESQKVDPTYGAEASLKVGTGKVVGTFLAKQSKGWNPMKGSQVSASYNLVS